MQNGNPILKSVRAALEREPRINLHRWPVHLDMTEDNALVLEGDMENIAAKKLALELAGALPDVRCVVDRLNVAAAEHKGDGEILDALTRFLLEARELKNCTLRVLKKGRTITLQEARDDNASGDIVVSVKEGVVTLDGWVISLAHKRMAGVLAWWVRGCRNVVDGLEVLPQEQDNDDEVSDALSLVLEMDPMIPHPGQIRVLTRNYVVTLEGLVGTRTEKVRAEHDAWCLFAVDKVINHLAVSGQMTARE
jgi:osmotically-inducible protein OsmY